MLPLWFARFGNVAPAVFIIIGEIMPVTLRCAVIDPMGDMQNLDPMGDMIIYPVVAEP